MSRIKLAGYAAVFNKVARIHRGGYLERIAPGAFRAALAGLDDIVACADHVDPGRVFARRSDGSLRLWEDARGLAFEASLDGEQWPYLVSDIRGRKFRGMSLRGRFSWQCVRTHEGEAREATAIELLHISLVRDPAYVDTSFRVVEPERVSADTLRKMRMRLALAEAGARLLDRATA